MKRNILLLTTAVVATSLIFSVVPTKVSAANNTQQQETVEEQGTVQDDFVQANGTSFTVNGRPFYFTGANSYDLFTLGDSSSQASVEDICSKYMDQKKIDARMQAMADNGVTVLRTWGFSNESWHGFETAPGEYVEPQFMLFDYIMDSARRHGIKVIITLENYWEAYGGIDKKLQWAGLSGGSHKARAQYFSNAQCKQWYKNYVKHFAERTNYFTGVKYKDDPTIFAWDLMNEPRYQDAGEDTTGITLRKWVDEMSSYVKSVDSNHMVCVGLEGHGSEYNFGGDEGNPYVYIQQSPNIDFCSAHPYPDEYWANLTPEQNAETVKKWINDAHEKVGKPFVAGEFNVRKSLSPEKYEAYWRSVYDTIYENGAAGALFWEFNDRQLSDFTVQNGDEVLKYYKDMSNKMEAKNLAGTMNSISVSNAKFDKAHPRDVVVQLNLVDDNTLEGLKNGETNLVKGKDYLVKGDKVVIRSRYLFYKLPLGTQSITFDVDNGNDPVLKVKITDSDLLEISSELGKTDVDHDRNGNTGITVPVKFKDNMLTEIVNGKDTLEAGKDYEVKNDSIVINKSYLDNLKDGSNELVFKFNKGESSTLTVNVSTIEKPVIPEWDAGKTYTGGEVVSYNGILYKAQWWTQGQAPDPSNQYGAWKVYNAA